VNKNFIWRAVAYSALINRDETHVFVDAPDYETAKQHLYERLSDEWGVPRGFIDFYNLWNEEQLREMSTGKKIPSGLQLLESGGGNGEVCYDHSPLILVASAMLREILEYALRQPEVRHG